LEEVSNWVPKHYIKCQTVYARLDEEARDTVDGRIWSGQMSVLVMQVGNYTNIMNSLKSMDCIEQLVRGGGPSESIWRLNHPPTMDLLKTVRKRIANNSVKTAQAALQASAILEDRVAALEKKVDLLIKAIEPIVRSHQPQ
jgi:hypothetical protein